MKMKLSDYVIQFVAELGIRHAFIVSGGASIHLLHSLEAVDGIMPICPHHEQAGAMSADAYARATGNLGCAIGTSGPGATNMITGIAGAWFDSVPVLYITGQVTTFRLKGDSGVRQYGFQETEIVPMVEPVTKYAVQISDTSEIRRELEKAVRIAKSGRPGPVLVDIPDDLQRAIIETDDLPALAVDETDLPDTNGAVPDLDPVLSMLDGAERPVIVLGTGVRLADAAEDACKLVERWNAPVLTSWGAKDILPADHPLNAGTFGTHGTRAGNFTMQNADAVVTIGARMSTRETGSPLSDWARGARVAVIDIDPAELRKFPAFDRPVDHSIVSDAGVAIRTLLEMNRAPDMDTSAWQERIADWRRTYPAIPDTAHDREEVDPYALMDILSDLAPDDAHVFTDTGCAVAWLMQAFRAGPNQRTYHDFNNTAMGWGLPAAIGGALALDCSTVCLTGDGSLMMNVQELATVAKHNLPIKIILLDNRGYSMVRQTEEQWLDGRNVGTSEASGLGFPDWVDLAQSFGLKTLSVGKNADLRSALSQAFAYEGPMFLHIEIAPEKRVLPQVAFGYPIEDPEPHLPRDEFLAQMIVDPTAKSREEPDPAKTLQRP